MAMFRQASSTNVQRLMGSRTATTVPNSMICPAMTPVAMSFNKMPRIPSIKAQFLLNFNPSTKIKMHKVEIGLIHERFLKRFFFYRLLRNGTISSGPSSGSVKWEKNERLSLSRIQKRCNLSSRMMELIQLPTVLVILILKVMNGRTSEAR